MAESNNVYFLERLAEFKTAAARAFALCAGCGELRDKESVSTGMDPFNFADALLGILAQHRTKKLCDCKEAYYPDAEEVKTFMAEYAEELRHSSAWKADPAVGTKKSTTAAFDCMARAASSKYAGWWAATSATRPATRDGLACMSS
ncbi:hypothetical protein GCM10011496_06250 [Polaromonas eurypsychrophila]|uniref:Uncharacterized protein n=1 Tax=Polaromonas eurypsychrophila TaxID=1614635 RepID=A0A916S7M9_9BURK|nr:hypothetical protein GCM10011496_06250 [Polaromonas eurypsychrophila]